MPAPVPVPVPLPLPPSPASVPVPVPVPPQLAPQQEPDHTAATPPPVVPAGVPAPSCYRLTRLAVGSFGKLAARLLMGSVELRRLFVVVVRRTAVLELAVLHTVVVVGVEVGERTPGPAGLRTVDMRVVQAGRPGTFREAVMEVGLVELPVGFEAGRG